MTEIGKMLRSPRETLGGFVILPRLIDKVRLSETGKLPDPYLSRLLEPAPAFDGRFLEFKKIEPDVLRRVILASPDDQAVLVWVERNGIPRSDQEKKDWIRSIEMDLPDPARMEARKKAYPEVAALFDVARMTVFDLIDLDEGRIGHPS
ncbi:MAG: DUF5069 domain-containing protein [Leptospirales bacterium]